MVANAAVHRGPKRERSENNANIPHFVTLDVLHNDGGANAHDHRSGRSGRPGPETRGRKATAHHMNWHEIGEHRFAHAVAEAIERHYAAGDFTHIVVVAPASTLAELRSHFSKRLHGAVLAEIDKDLTKHPIYEMEKVLLAS